MGCSDTLIAESNLWVKAKSIDEIPHNQLARCSEGWSEIPGDSIYWRKFLNNLCKFFEDQQEETLEVAVVGLVE